MATRGRIGIELSDGSILSAYHHWDSYPQWLGKKLVEHFNSRELASELIDGGDMSCCWTKDRWDGKESSEDGPQYYSQRGEDCPPRVDTNLLAYTYKESGEEYHYLFTKGEWVCYDMHSFDYRKHPEITEIPSN